MLRFGSLTAGVAWLSGDELFLPEPMIDLGVIQPGELVTAKLPVVNLARHPVTILGADSGCSCTVVSGLPVTIPAGMRFNLPVRVTPFANSTGDFSQGILIFSDSKPEELNAQVRATVVSNQ